MYHCKRSLVAQSNQSRRSVSSRNGWIQCAQPFSSVPPKRFIQCGLHEESSVRGRLQSLQASRLAHPRLRPALQVPSHRAHSGREAGVDLPASEEAGRVQLRYPGGLTRESSTRPGLHHGPLCLRPCPAHQLQVTLPCKQQMCVRMCAA